MSGAADDIAGGIMAKWAAAFGRLDADALSSLYSKHALFFGSNPTLYRGRGGVADYFNALPRWRSCAVQFTDVVTEPANPDLINVAGAASFVADEGALNFVGENNLGHCPRRWRLENCQPSCVVQDPTDLIRRTRSD